MFPPSSALLPLRALAFLSSLPPLALALTLAACGGSTSSVTGGDGGDGAGGDGGPGATGDSGSGADGGGGISHEQAATDAANAYCARAEACASVYVTSAFGDVTTCEARLKTQLLNSLSAPGSSATPAQFETCAAALPQVACSDLLGNMTITACQTLPGSLAAGAACGTDAQCSTAHCTRPTTATCGTCAARAAAGGACGVDSDCQPGMTCRSGMCAPYGAKGAMCSATRPCRTDLGCVGGTCGTPSAAGTACKTSAECDQLAGAFCNPQTLVCQTITFAQAGGACGLVGGQLVLCAGPGSDCKGDNVSPYQGTCEAYAVDGASCDTDGGPLCDYGAVCVGGTCQVSDPASCK